jgi:hypothetical protein
MHIDNVSMFGEMLMEMAIWSVKIVDFYRKSIKDKIGYIVNNN